SAYGQPSSGKSEGHGDVSWPLGAIVGHPTGGVTIVVVPPVPAPPVPVPPVLVPPAPAPLLAVALPPAPLPAVALPPAPLPARAPSLLLAPASLASAPRGRTSTCRSLRPQPCMASNSQDPISAVRSPTPEPTTTA